MADAAIRGYATALFTVAQAEGALDQISDELFRFARTMEREIRLRDALVDPQLPAEQKSKVVEELLGGKASPHTIGLIGFVIAQGRARELPAIIDALVEVAAEEAQKAVAEVRSAVPLGETERDRLRAAIARATGKHVDVKVLVDPSVVGGLMVRVGDVVFDGTVRRRLQLAKEHLERG
ncbi:MAG: ATP synthase F1 subunit delta [Actinomycetota bacterium]|nr:ATP synthase F1 subunit delta [Actinomycetota bacterium]